MSSLSLNNSLQNKLAVNTELPLGTPTAQERAIALAEQGDWANFSKALFNTRIKQAPTAQKAPTSPSQAEANPYAPQLIAQRESSDPKTGTIPLPTYSYKSPVKELVASKETGTIPLRTDRDTGLGKVQAQRPDGVVVGGELIQRLKGTGYVEYYLKGPQESHPLPKTISSKQEAMEYVRTEIEKGNFKDLERGDQNAKGIRPISSVSKAPQSWRISGKGPTGDAYTGELMQPNLGTGTSNTQFVFKQATGSRELPATITSLKSADRYVREQIRTGNWKNNPKNLPAYDSGISDTANTYRFDKRQDVGNQTDREIAFDKNVDRWVNDYVGQRFPGPLRKKAEILLEKILDFYGDKPEQPYIRAAMKDVLNSSRSTPENALKILETIRLEMSGEKARPLQYSGMSPLKTLEHISLQNMGRRTFNDLTDMILSVQNMSTDNTETLQQTRDRVRAEGHIRKFAQSTGQTNITNIVIKPRSANNVIALTHQESSASFMKHPSSFAADISYESKGIGGVPLKSSFTAWFNPSVFARIGTPYVDSKGGAIDPQTGKKVPATAQLVVRAGTFEAGIQGNVGLNTSIEQSRYANTGFSFALRGPSFKAVIDVDPSDPKKMLKVNPSFNMSLDMSGYVTLGIFRVGPYVELGRFAKGKSTAVVDKFNIGANPEFLKDVAEGRFNAIGNPYKNLAPLSPY